MKRRFSLSVLTVMLCWAVLPVDAHAQDVSVAPSTNKSPATSPAEEFARALEPLAQQEKIAFVVESRPTAQLSVSAQDVTPKTDDPILNKVNTAADTFGYSVERRGKVFLLRKRYNTPTDLPDISIAECVTSLRAIDGFLAPLNPAIEQAPSGVDSLSYMFLRHVTLAQVNSMAKDGLPVSELSQGAQQAVQTLTQHLYTGALYKEFHIAYKMLEAIDNNPTYLVLNQEEGKTVFGYETRAYKGQRLYNVTSKGVNGTSTTISTAKGDEPFYVSLEVYKDVPLPNNLGQPDATGVSTQTEVPPAPTLRDVTGKLTSGTTVCDVDETLATKTVTLIGTDNLLASDLMQHLANLYGLRHRDDGSLYLTSRAVPNVRGMADVTPALRAAVPDVLVRAVRGRSNNPNSYSKGAQEIREEAIRRLRKTVEPKLKELADHRIVLSDLTPEEQRLFAVAVSTSRLSRVAEFSQAPVPVFATGLETTILAGGLGKDDSGKSIFMFFLTIRNPQTGQLMRGPGFWTPDYKLPDQ